MSKSIIQRVLVLLAVAVLFVSCAPNGYTDSQYGFFSGIWHGIIIVFSLLGKLIGSDIGIYAEHNTGFTYWLGFLVGVVCFGGGGTMAKR